ncbi:hypothetical protein WBJ53_02010 [Spirosoma sp. SC4-14]|uniref:hypothetical protein n=1 Tax=Spirosoma sp. SC4-14 TaxID=3128900 RepID=UPI0030CF3E4A
MRQSILIGLVIIGSLTGLTWYFSALADLFSDFVALTYEQNFLALLPKTVTLLLYTYSGIHFLRKKTNLL